MQACILTLHMMSYDRLLIMLIRPVMCVLGYVQDRVHVLPLAESPGEGALGELRSEQCCQHGEL